ENLSLLEEGIVNLEKHIENVKIFGIPVVVAINRFTSDTEREIDFVKKKAEEFGAYRCEVSQVWAEGSLGGLNLARAVIEASRQPKNFHFLYPLELPIKEKIRIIATRIYGAKDVEYSKEAEEKIRLFTQRGWDKLPICMAKTHLSLSHDPHLKGKPSGFVLPIRDIRASCGAGFLYPLCGKIQTMPGLPSHPRGEMIDIDEKGNIVGLS
ncbi:MAG: formate--tetrahydrofolate ligase, partial [Candidatus Omnitrophica bacterium]|nr:formate--tetrahydrofolate ligase [Candidatus Omnitrophota bacterium]